MIFSVWPNFALANCFASRSFGNVSVPLANARFPRGSSNETYHKSCGLLAMKPPAILTELNSRLGRDKPHPFRGSMLEQLYSQIESGTGQTKTQKRASLSDHRSIVGIHR